MQMQNPRPKKRKYRRWGELPKLAAFIADRPTSSVYKVLRGEFRSSRIEGALAQAKRQLQSRNDSA